MGRDEVYTWLRYTQLCSGVKKRRIASCKAFPFMRPIEIVILDSRLAGGILLFTITNPPHATPWIVQGVTYYPCHII